MNVLCRFWEVQFSFFGVWLYLVAMMIQKWLGILILLVLSAIFNRTVAQVVAADSLIADTSVSQAITSPGEMNRIDSLVQYAYTFIGNRYRRGGTTSAGFDCSGYTLTVFKKFGIKLPHTSAGQGLVGVAVSRPNIKKGDLILFKGRSRKSSRIGHVGIVISEKGQPVRFIHSSTSEGVRIDRLDYVYYKKRYVKTVRIPELYK